MNLQNVKLFTSQSVGTGPSSYEKDFTGPRSHKFWKTLEQSANLRYHEVGKMDLIYGRRKYK